jgi:FkbM family methyltransferase
MGASEPHLDAIASRLADEAFAERVRRLEAMLDAERLRSAALEEDGAKRLATIRACEARIQVLEEDGAARLAEIHRLANEVVRLRAEVAVPLRTRIKERILRGPRKLDFAPPMASAVPAATPRPVPGEEPAETVVFKAMSTERALARIARRGLEVGTVIDVGASNGMWSEACRRQLTTARYLLVEAQETHRSALESYCARTPRCEFVLAAAGPRIGEIWFDDGDPFGGVASETPTAAMKRRVPMTTLDHEVASRGLPGPYLVKLDVHGFEVPILEGAAATLAQASLVVIECYAFRVAEGSLLLDEMIAWMRERGFGLVDASEPLWRVRDGCLWQMDLFFQPATRPELSVHRWS